MYKNTDTKINNKKKYKLELAPRLGRQIMWRKPWLLKVGCRGGLFLMDAKTGKT